jgi:alpha-glucoside transport system substrate-binding protein
MKRIKWVVLLAAFALVIAACGDDDDAETTTTQAAVTTAGGDMVDMTGVEFTLFGAPQAAEADAMQGFVDVYNSVVGSNIVFEGSDSYETQLRIRVDGGNPPPVSFTPQPGSICEFADEGHLVALEDMGFDIAEMEGNHGKFWMDLGLCADGKHYGIPWFPNYKSIVFYHEPTFTEMGYAIPSTYEDLIALSEQIVSDGMTPWCFAFESDQASGWPGTDWLEDIVVRNSGGEVYAQWFKHEIPFNDPAIAEAFDLFGQIFFGDGFVLGGTDGVAAINFRDTPLPAFNDPPGCLMFKQGSFIANFFPEGGEDIMKTFPFPTIGGNAGAMGGGDTIIVFDAQPEYVQAIKDWITPEWQCVLASPSGGTASQYGGHGVAGVERLPGHKDVSPDCYETEAAKGFATAITDALAVNGFVFDASDLMPPEVGQGSFWTGMIDWSRGAPTQEVVDAIEASWP